MTKELADMCNDRVINPGGILEHVRSAIPSGSPPVRPPDGPVPTGGANIISHNGEKLKR